MQQIPKDKYFLSLVMMLATTAWQQLGKIPSPVTGKVERDVPSAGMTIDLLTMLRDKTKGNLSPEEDKILANTLSDLQLNFADEAAKQPSAADAPAAPKD